MSESQLFYRDKQAWESAIEVYKGNDPLELWFNYICWYDYNIHLDLENKFQQILEKCLSIFEHHEIYKQDMRMVKLWVKYIDLQPNPLNFYQILYQRGVGTQCASFYIGWAHYYDSASAFKQAESVYNLGFQAKAEPYTELQEAHTKFRLSVSQRMLYNDSSSKKRSVNNLIEQRQQITALHANQFANTTAKKNRIDQISEPEEHDNLSYSPHQVQYTMSTTTTTTTSGATTNNKDQNIYMEMDRTAYAITPSQTPQLHYILENVKLPQNFCQLAKNNFETWKPVLFVEESLEIMKTCFYQKHLVYPERENTEYSPEEIRAKKWLQRHQLSKKPSNHLLSSSSYMSNGHGIFYENDVRNEYVQQKSKSHNYTATECIAEEKQENHYVNGNTYSPQQQHQQQQQKVNYTLHNNTATMINTVNENPEICYNTQNDSLTYETMKSHQDLQNSEMGSQNFIVDNNNMLSYSSNNYDDRSHQYHHHLHQHSTNSDQNAVSHYAQQKSHFDGIAEILNDDYSTYSSSTKTYNTEEKQQQQDTIDNNNSGCFENEFIEKYHDKSSQTTTMQNYNRLNHHQNVVQDNLNEVKNPYHNDDDIESQIEASTIRFSTDTNGKTKNKTITIKFRKEVTNSNLDYSSKQIERKRQHTETSFNEELNYENNSIENHSSVIQMTSTPLKNVRSKRVKKLKIINNYDKCKSPTQLPSSSSSSFEATKQSKSSDRDKSITLKKLSHDHDSNANLTLPLARTFDDSNSFNDSNTSTLCSQRTNDSCYNDSTLNTEFNISSNESSNFMMTKFFSKRSATATTTTSTIQNLSSVHQNDDSICSYEQNSFFTTDTNDEESVQKRLTKALITIDTHFSKTTLDPFSNELCKAFLVKLNFPSRSGGSTNEIYKLIDTPIPKLTNMKSTNLAETNYNIEKEVGRGSYGSVYKAVNTTTGAVVALKYQKPPNMWEIYICCEVRKRIKNYNILPGFMNISSAIIAPNASIIVTEFSVYGSLLDVNNKVRQATKKIMHESLAIHFGSQILDIVSHLHSCKIIHADIKPDNFLLMKIPQSDSLTPSLRLIDFGCAIDMKLFPENTQFRKVIQTDGFTCIEMQEGRPWSYQTDLFCVAGTIHVMLFGEYMQTIKKFDQWDIKQKLPRYLKKHLWNDFFSKMLNIENLDNLPNLIELKASFDNELIKMDSELQMQIRTLSNILHRR